MVFDWVSSSVIKELKIIGLLDKSHYGKLSEPKLVQGEGSCKLLYLTAIFKSKKPES